MPRLLGGLLLAIFLLAPQPGPAAELAAPRGAVADYAGVINDTFRGKIEQTGRELYERAGVNLVVATVQGLEGVSIERKAESLFSLWDLDAKAPRGAVLVLLSLKERAGRIQFSPGLAGVLDDDTRDMIQTQALLPDLRKNQFGKGLYQGACAISHVLAKSAGVKLPGVPLVRLRENRDILGLEKVWFLVALVLLIGWLRRRVKRRTLRTGPAPVKTGISPVKLAGLFKNLARSSGPKAAAKAPAQGFRAFGGGGFGGFGGA